MTTTIEQPAGEVLAAGMQIKEGFTDLHSDAVETFNADAIAHGKAWDKTTTDSETLIESAETLKFADLQKKLSAIASAQLKLLQERLKMFTRRQELLQDIHTELNGRLEALENAKDAVRKTMEDGLRAAGDGPEDSQLWKRGSTNLATIEFNKRVESTASFIDAQKAVWETKNLLRRFHSANEWSSESEIKATLRNFVANMTGLAS